MKTIPIAVMLVLAGGAFAVFFASTGVTTAAQVSEAKTVYTCPMHPSYTLDRPGACPICGMDLVKKQATEPLTTGVKISTEKQQLIGVRTDVVKVRPLAVEIRANGRVTLDQEMYDAEKEYINGKVFISTYWNAAYQKLLILGMSEQEIEALKVRRWADEGLIAIGPADKGHYYRTPYPGTSLVYAAVFENEVALIKPGDAVDLTAQGFPGEMFRGTVAGIAQAVDPQTRTVRVRVRVEDKERRLRPEMFMITTIRAALGDKLSVPVDAVLDSGKRKVVYTVSGETFTPQEVVLGPQAGDFFEVLSGLKPDDKVVIGGNFLVDAESRLKSAQ